jgi:hypothetical protein
VEPPPLPVVRCLGDMRGGLIVLALTTWTCSSRRSPPISPEAGGKPFPVRSDPDRRPTTDRIVRLPSTLDDTSCLDRAGGTVVVNELSDDDVRRIEALIGNVDPLPIMSIGHPTFVFGARDAGDNEFEGMTGVECGPLSGHGTVYRISRARDEWRITVTGQWAS